MFTIGTANFVSRQSAVRYYASYNYDAEDVDRMIAEDAIHIGPPLTKPDERLVLLDDNTRYGIRGA